MLYMCLLSWALTKLVSSSTLFAILTGSLLLECMRDLRPCAILKSAQLCTWWENLFHNKKMQSWAHCFTACAVLKFLVVLCSADEPTWLCVLCLLWANLAHHFNKPNSPVTPLLPHLVQHPQYPLSQHPLLLLCPMLCPQQQLCQSHPPSSCSNFIKHQQCPPPATLHPPLLARVLCSTSSSLCF